MKLTLPNARISISVATPGDWNGDLLVIPTIAPEQQRPGWPGKHAGDLIFLAEGDEPSRTTPARAQVSLGQADQISPAHLRDAGGRLAAWLIDNEIRSVGVPVANLDACGLSGAVAAFIEGVNLGAYRFDQHKSERGSGSAIEMVLLAERELDDLRHQVDRIGAITAGVNLAREWSNQPPNRVNPLSLAEGISEHSAQLGFTCTVLGQNELEALGASALLSVGRGSRTPAQMIVMEYVGPTTDPDSAPIVLLGKAITFDTGGYSIKDRKGMLGMKYDKCAGMTVLGTMAVVAGLQMEIRVVGIIAAAENMISSDAYRPNDIIRTMSGKTVEIISTDAEGRLALADSLTYAQSKYAPRAIIDLATLTGGIIVALGKVRAGIMANDDRLANALIAAGERTNERLWRMPLDDDYADLIRGSDSDLRNSTTKREAHPVVGAIFLKQFVAEGVPWAHIDIAGTATTDEARPSAPRGATGFGVRLLVDYLKNEAESR